MTGGDISVLVTIGVSVAGVSTLLGSLLNKV